MSTPSSEPASSRWRIWAAVGGGLVIVILLFVAGGGGNSQSETGPEGNAEETERAEAELRRQLSQTLDGLRPERVGVSSDLESQVDDLNLWWVDYSEATGALAPADAARQIGRWLGDEASQTATADRFSVRDAAHIRDCLLYRAAAQSIAAFAGSDLERCIAAFDLAMRQVSYVNRSESDPPLTAFGVLLLGRGNANERAWAFIEILRQLEIDAVVLRPADDAAQATPLVGAIVPDRGVCLFDPAMGLPIPAAADDSAPLPQQPATLAEVIANDALLRQFDIPEGNAYPWTSELLKTAAVCFVTNAIAASPKMQSLELALPAEYSARLYDGLVAIEGERLPLDQRIIAAGSEGPWQPEQVQAWQFPEQRSAAFFAAGGEQAPALQRDMRILRGPRVIRRETGADGNPILIDVDSPQPLRAVRVMHIRGELPDALAAYGSIRSAPQELGELNVYAREEAVYWIGICQYELQRYDAAVSTFVLSLRDYPGGSWTQSALSFLALSEMQRGNREAALNALETASGGSPTFREAFLKRRWSAAEAPATTETE
jgi:tetratricopeptide (TPR) repeat protein